MRRWFRSKKDRQLPQPASRSQRFTRLPARIDRRSMRTGRQANPPRDREGGRDTGEDLRYFDPFDG